MPNIALTFGVRAYDRMQAFARARHPPDRHRPYLSDNAAGGNLLAHAAITRSSTFLEMSMSNYLMAASRENCPFVAIPVFPSRVFRHGYIFINADKGIETPKDLIGRRAGVPEYSQTAAVHARAVLEHEYGVPPSAIEWVQGRADRAGVSLPSNIRIQQAPAGHELSDMLERGEIDFLVTGKQSGGSLRRRSPKVRRLFPNYRELEIAYFKKTRESIRSCIWSSSVEGCVRDRHPWVASSMYKKRSAPRYEYCYRTMRGKSGLKGVARLLLQPLIEEEKEIFGEDWRGTLMGLEPKPLFRSMPPFGSATNRALVPRMPSLEELFAPTTLRDIPLGEGQFIW